MQKKKQLRAPSSVGRYNSTQVGGGRKYAELFSLAINKEGTYLAAGKGDKGTLCDPGSELLILLGGTVRVAVVVLLINRIINGIKKKRGRKEMDYAKKLKPPSCCYKGT